MSACPTAKTPTASSPATPTTSSAAAASADADWRFPRTRSAAAIDAALAPAGWADDTPSWAGDPFEQRVADVASYLALPGDPYPRKPVDALDASLAHLEAIERANGSDGVPANLHVDMSTPDPVDHPAHYATGWSNGAEVIDLTEHLSFCRGNAIKYLARAGRKSAATEIEDLRKAAWYVTREIARLEAQA